MWYTVHFFFLLMYDDINGIYYTCKHYGFPCLWHCWTAHDILPSLSLQELLDLSLYPCHMAKHLMLQTQMVYHKYNFIFQDIHYSAHIFIATCSMLDDTNGTFPNGKLKVYIIFSYMCPSVYALLLLLILCMMIILVHIVLANIVNLLTHDTTEQFIPSCTLHFTWGLVYLKLSTFHTGTTGCSVQGEDISLSWIFVFSNLYLYTLYISSYILLLLLMFTYSNKVDRAMLDSTVKFLTEDLKQVIRYCTCIVVHSVFHWIRCIWFLCRGNSYFTSVYSLQINC